MNEDAPQPVGPLLAEPAPSGGMVTLAVQCAVGIWLLQVITGFRLPWSPIVVTDGDSGAAVRQLVFTGGGLIGTLWLFLNARLAHVLPGRGPVFVLVAWTMLSAVYSIEPDLTIKRSIILAFCVTMLVAIVTSVRDPLAVLARWVTAATGLAAWISIAVSIVLPANCWSIAERPGLAGVTGHPNQLGSIVGIGLLVSLGIHARGLEGMLVLVAQVGLVLALVMTKSMTCLSFTIIGVALFLVLRARPKSLMTAAVIAAPVIAAAACLGFMAIRDGLLSAAGKDASLSGRTELWHVVLQQISERPILGTGFGAFWREGRGRELVGNWNPRQSHEAYFDVMLDLGLVGLCLVAAVIGSVTVAPVLASVARGVRLSRQSAATIAMVLGLCGSYGLGESFLLKTDKFPFFVVLWVALAFSARVTSLDTPVESRQ